MNKDANQTAKDAHPEWEWFREFINQISDDQLREHMEWALHRLESVTHAE